MPYNFVISLIGASALILLDLAGLFGDLIAEPVWADEVRSVAIVTGVLMATAGHWIAVGVCGAVHRRERPLYRYGGWGPLGLWLCSWFVSGALGVVVIVVVS